MLDWNKGLTDLWYPNQDLFILVIILCRKYHPTLDDLFHF